MLNPQLNNKVVLITGVNSPYGIGAATAQAFAAQGAAVIATYLPAVAPSAPTAPLPADMGEAFYNAVSNVPPDATIAQIRAQHGRIEAVPADLADIAAIPRIFDVAEATFGPVSILINNAAHCVQDTFLPPAIVQQAGTAVDGFPMRTITPETIDQHFAVNTRATALLIAEYARRHVERGATWGRIISVSTDGAVAFASEVSYGASKYALESYNRAAAKELGQFGITVNIVRLARFKLAGSRPRWPNRSPKLTQSAASGSPLTWPTRSCCLHPNRRAGSPASAFTSVADTISSAALRASYGPWSVVCGPWSAPYTAVIPPSHAYTPPVQ